MTSSYPRFTGQVPFVVESRIFAQIQEIVGVVRNLRNELGVQPGKRGRAVLRVSSEEEKLALADGADLIGLLAKMEAVAVVCGGDDPSPAGVGVAGTVEIFLPMKGLVDLTKEKARLAKEQAKIEGWLRGCRAKLANEKFTANAPDHVIDKQRALLQENEAKVATIQARIQALD